MNPLPSSIPILPLSNHVLLPSIITSFTLCQTEAKQLTQDSYVICVPLDNQHLSHYGCLAQIIDQDHSIPNQSIIKLKGICPSRIKDVMTSDGGDHFEAAVEHCPANEDVLDPEDLVRFRSLCEVYLSSLRSIGVSVHVIAQVREVLKGYPVAHVAHLLLYLIDAPKTEKLKVLETLDLREKLGLVDRLVTLHIQVINTSVLNKNHDMLYDNIRRKFYVSQHLHSITTEMNIENQVENHFEIYPEDDDDLIDLIEKLNQADLPIEAYKVIKKEINRLRKLPASAADASILKTYLDYVSDLPWSKQDQIDLNIHKVKKQLDADHYGIDIVKNRILEYLSVLKIKKDAKPPILCFVGPPGVGKTTLAKSIALALERKFYRISLGGVRDEAEIRGHRRTYVGALPGLLIHGMRQCAVQNPIILLDEIDKIVTHSNQGDPAAALLEVLDPAQNGNFTDHYLNLPYDLSKVMFIATANQPDQIPGPLLDRLELIQLEGYSYQEKHHIAKTHLIPKQNEAHGIDVTIPDPTLLRMIEGYTRESGVRHLERLIGSICRFKCKEYAELLELNQLERFRSVLEESELEKILGMDCLEDEMSGRDLPGIVSGLAYAGSGNGGVMAIEASTMPGTGGLKLTGSLGDVIKESAQIAVSWVRANAYALKLTNSAKQDIFKEIDLHIHMPSGAVPKDGPSAGITMVICLLSVLLNRVVPHTTAMTGEVTLRGQVRAVGGIKEKVMGAHRAGVTRVLLPVANKRDVQQLSAEIKEAVQFVYCKSIWDVIDSVFDHLVKSEPRFTSSL